MLASPAEHGATDPVVLPTFGGRSVAVRLGTAILGGEACVYRGALASEDVAVKVALHPGADGEWIFEEGDLLDRLGGAPHPAVAVVRVRDRGRWNGRPFLVLDWCEDTVAAWTERDPPTARRLAMAAAIADLVEALHRLDPPVVHRDLKPSNILLDRERPKLADFGAARTTDRGQATTTLCSYTSGFAPPEALLPMRRRPDVSQDEYALAATVFFVLTGRPPAAAVDNARCLTPAGVRLLRTGRADAPLEALVDLGRMVALTKADERALLARCDGTELLALLRRMLAPAPGRRSGTAAALAAVLRRTRPEPVRRERPLLALAPVAALAVSLAVGHARTMPPAPSYPAVTVPAGTYPVVGPEGPEHVRLVAPLRVGRAEVDQALWRALGGAPMSARRTFMAGGLGRDCADYYGLSLVGDALPVVCVDFVDAVSFANTLSVAHGLEPAYTVVDRPGHEGPSVRWRRSADGWRLPTEQEWEIAARAGDLEPLPAAERCRRANLGDQELLLTFPDYDGAGPCSDASGGPSPVRAHAPNAWGLYGALGNVLEWVWAPTDGRTGVTRGAGFTTPADLDPIAFRGTVPFGERQPTIGFRLVRSGR